MLLNKIFQSLLGHLSCFIFHSVVTLKQMCAFSPVLFETISSFLFGLLLQAFELLL